MRERENFLPVRRLASFSRSSGEASEACDQVDHLNVAGEGSDACGEIFFVARHDL